MSACMGAIQVGPLPLTSLSHPPDINHSLETRLDRILIQHRDINMFVTLFLFKPFTTSSLTLPFSLPPPLFLLHLHRHPPSFSPPLPPPSSSLLRIPSSNIHSSLVFTHNENTIAKDRNQTSSNDRAVLRLFIPAQVSAIQRRVCELMNSIYCPLSPLQPPHCTISFISHVWL